MEKPINNQNISDCYEIQDYKNAILAVKIQIDNWEEIYEENAKDGDRKSMGLLLGYRALKNTFNLHFDKFLL